MDCFVFQMQRTRFVTGNRQIYSWILVGIMQNTVDCGKPDSFALFSDAFYVKKWLNKVISGAKSKRNKNTK